MSTIVMMVIAVIAELSLRLCRRRKFDLSYLNMWVTLVVMIVFGLGGALVSHYIEMGYWGIRYYGTIFIIVLALIPTARMICVPYNKLMDYVAPQMMLVIIVMKYNCLTKGCCEGKVIWYSFEGVARVFPSQLVELFTAIIIFFLLLGMENNKKCKEYVFPVFMLLYGSTRLVFDYLRADQGRIFEVGNISISVGGVFCCLIIVIGCINMLQRINKSKQYDQFCKSNQL